MNVTISIECQKCGADLGYDTEIFRDGALCVELRVKPCSSCLKEASEAARGEAAS